MAVMIRQSVFVVPALAEIAERGGHFAAAGVEVQTERVVSSAQQWADLREGRCEVAVTAIDNLFVWNARAQEPPDEIDIALLGQIETTTLLTLVLRPGLGSLAEAGVARLAVDAPDNGFAVVLRTMVEALPAGRRPRGYELVPAGGVRQRFDALLAGEVDATLLSAPLDDAAVRSGASIALTVGEVLSGYPGLGIVAPRSADPDAVSGYLQGLGSALAWVRAADPSEVAALLASADQGPAAVAALLATLPVSLEPEPAGVALLASIRQSLGMSVPGAPGPDQLLRPPAAAGAAQ